MNLIGDHTDYNDGFVLPAAIQLECVVAVAPRGDGRVIARSAQDPERVDVAADGSETGTGWGRYVAGVARALAERGRPAVGADLDVASSVPSGSGLSSSAALEVALALALCDVADWTLPPRELALTCQRAERFASGVAGGVMDQIASLLGEDGQALLLDCRSLEIDLVPLSGIDVVAIHSGLPRTLAGSAYAERRAECERLAKSLGLTALRDATLDQVADNRFGRHVVTENARVHETAAALRARDVARAGELFVESHASLRDDYRVSTPELDALVEELLRAGAAGARLTGAGFGGCVVALADEHTARAAADRYAERTGRTPTVYPCRAVSGASELAPMM